LDFSIDVILPYGPGFDSGSERNEYQDSSWQEREAARKADTLTAICEPIVFKMWEPVSHFLTYATGKSNVITKPPVLRF
jgi:hypothetical protein